jgi:hypothetical protein
LPTTTTTTTTTNNNNNSLAPFGSKFVPLLLAHASTVLLLHSLCKKSTSTCRRRYFHVAPLEVGGTMTAAAGTKRSSPQNSRSSEDPRSNDGKVAERWSLGAEREREQQVPAFLAHYNFCGEASLFSLAASEVSRRCLSCMARVPAASRWLFYYCGWCFMSTACRCLDAKSNQSAPVCLRPSEPHGDHFP